MDQKKQIVFVWNYLNWGGAQIYFLAIIKVARPDWSVLVILPRGSSQAMIGFLEELNIDHEFSDHPIDLSPANTIAKKIKRQTTRLKSEFATFSRLKGFDYRRTIFHVEVAPWQSWIFLTAMAMRGMKTVVTMHNIMPAASSWREYLWKMRLEFLSRLRLFRIIASNDDTKELLKPFVSNTFWRKIEVAPTAVDPKIINTVYNSTIKLDQIREKFGIDKEKFVVLSVGQFIDRKGRWIFMDAAKRLCSDYRDLQFIWLTPELPSESEIEKITEYGVGESVRFILSESLGKERNDVINFFRIADAFALPSFVEGLPIALLEAMSLGIPSISTNVFAIPEAVKNRVTGILIEPGDAKALADSIVELMSDSDLRNSIAEKGREFVLKHFNEQDSAQKVLTVYEELLAG